VEHDFLTQIVPVREAAGVTGRHLANDAGMLIDQPEKNLLFVNA
jgi:hypothetical protein